MTGSGLREFEKECHHTSSTPSCTSLVCLSSHAVTTPYRRPAQQGMVPAESMLSLDRRVVDCTVAPVGGSVQYYGVLPPYLEGRYLTLPPSTASLRIMTLHARLPHMRKIRSNVMCHLAKGTMYRSAQLRVSRRSVGGSAARHPRA